MKKGRWMDIKTRARTHQWTTVCARIGAGAACSNLGLLARNRFASARSSPAWRLGDLGGEEGVRRRRAE